MKYEVVCTKNYLDVGLLVERDGTKPKKILSRNSTHGLGSYYGGVEKIKWIHTSVFLSKDEWNKITLDKPTDQILYELNIKKIYLQKYRHEDNYLVSIMEKNRKTITL